MAIAIFVKMLYNNCNLMLVIEAKPLKDGDAKLEGLRFLQHASQLPQGFDSAQLRCCRSEALLFLCNCNGIVFSQYGRPAPVQGASLTRLRA